MCICPIENSMKLESKKGWKSIVPFQLNSRSVRCFCLLSDVVTENCGAKKTPVYLNVYDLTPMNGYVYWAGLGIFHSGVEVHSVEYAFGAHDYASSGIFEVEPRQCPGFQFRKSVFIGTTSLDANEVREFMQLQASRYNGDTYHLIVKNCNHFCNDICYKLTGKRIPRWVNRLANLGSIFNFVLPETLRITTVQRDPKYQAYDDHHDDDDDDDDDDDEDEEEDDEDMDDDSEKRRLRSTFTCLSSISYRQQQLSTSSLLLQSPLKGCLPWELKRSANGSTKER